MPKAKSPKQLAGEKEQAIRQENLCLIRQCIADARNVLKDEKMMDMQSHVLSIAIALFRQRALTSKQRGEA
jgi:hypothetical protein